jgi:1,4-dihydroxy-2-naphthoate octaprenyltransferase
MVTALWSMARPLIMVSVILVFIIGNLIARANGYALRGETFAWGLITLILVALSIHYANEYADYETDALTKRTPFSGGSGVLPSGLAPRSLAIHAAWVALVLGGAVAISGYVRGVFNLTLLFVLAAGALGGWMYSLPPLALAWRGWGEFDNAMLGGILLPLYGYTLQTGRIDWEVVVGCIPFALLVFVNLLATTWADRHADAQAGKYTLATRLTVKRLRWLYFLAVLLCFSLLPLLADRVLPHEVALSGVLAVPLVLWGAATYTRIDSPHPTVFAMVALLLLQLTAWFLIGG